MRFRVKCNGQTAKVEVPGTSCKFWELKAAVAAQLFPEDPTALDELQLSFNNRDAIQGEADTDVKGLGLTSGDLLWVLGPHRSAPPQPAPEPKRAKEAAPREPAAATQPAAAEQTGPSRALAGGTGYPAAPAPQAMETEERRRPQEEVMGQNSGAAGNPSTEQELGAAAAHAVPGYLLRALTHNAGAGTPFPSTPAHVLLLAGHAAMLETGFDPTWGPSPSGHPPGEASGGAATDPTTSPYALPASAQLSASIFCLHYRLPVLQQSGGGSGGSSSEEGAAGGACCMLQCSTMGTGTAVLVASTPRGHTHALPLMAASFFEEASPAAAPAPIPGPGSMQGGDGPRSLGQSPAAGPAAAAAAPGAWWDGQRMWVLGGRCCAGAESIRRLWRAVKDGLAFPMLLAAYADAGLPPPAGLLALPQDLKLAIMEQLNALQLVVLSVTCAELRHLASQDDLWEPLFRAEFPAASSFYTSQAARRGWKWAFGACWRDRKQREEAVRRQRRLMPAIPNLGPRPPFYPPPGRMGIPGITGGDYDRLPQPFLGGGPGMFPGGGLGGMMLGGGRRQGGRGGGGYHMF